MFSRWSFAAPIRHGEPSSYQKDARGHRRGSCDHSRDGKRIGFFDIDTTVSRRESIFATVKENSQLDQAVEILKQKFPTGNRRIPDDAQVQFFWDDKRLDGPDIPNEAQVLTYRVLKAGDDGSIRIIWQGTGLKLPKPQLEAIARGVAEGKTVGSIREIIAELLRASNESKAHLVKDANQIIVEATGGLRPSPLQGNSWEARKVQNWLCRYLTIDLVPVGEFFVLHGFNEKYVYHKPTHTEVPRIKGWLKDHVFSSVYIRRPRRRNIGIDIGDIKLFYRGRLAKRSTHIRLGSVIDFEVPRAFENKFLRIEAWLVPLTETCIVCNDEKRISEMPNKKRITSSCKHNSEMCKGCIAQWITTSLDTTTWDHLRCPECPQLLTYENVRAFASPEVFQRYDTLAMRALVSSIPEFVWCCNPRCSFGQIHPTGCSRAKCHECKRSLCVRHNILWHKGETCEEYERRRQRNQKNNEASEKCIQEIAKPCPGCKRNIFKYTGCDHVTCTCGHEWCWLCFGEYYRDQREFLQCRHKMECEYRRNPPGYEGGRAFMPFLNIPGEQGHARRAAPPPPPRRQIQVPRGRRERRPLEELLPNQGNIPHLPPMMDREEADRLRRGMYGENVPPNLHQNDELRGQGRGLAARDQMLLFELMNEEALGLERERRFYEGLRFAPRHR
ncbi:uncharacterized protein F4822DRAFT_91881 [Hypoxylon trugodes]|uniref:uncharacterized protein n=1 Tax=Hypoxylon trugodes TaxID=326681 RepID=UPI0021A07902|nr:uncharacterized protein F4822DRAFT_91881 [Hypoxylon trugodes]KAI1383078.1 hypothetical protein F4822DRAFT_91881 [Hypoxylon trugodes]